MVLIFTSLRADGVGDRCLGHVLLPSLSLPLSATGRLGTCSAAQTALEFITNPLVWASWVIGLSAGLYCHTWILVCLLLSDYWFFFKKSKWYKKWHLKPFLDTGFMYIFFWTSIFWGVSWWTQLKIFGDIQLINSFSFRFYGFLCVLSEKSLDNSKLKFLYVFYKCYSFSSYICTLIQWINFGTVWRKGFPQEYQCFAAWRKCYLFLVELPWFLCWNWPMNLDLFLELWFQSIDLTPLSSLYPHRAVWIIADF